jgi:hypothetical protein
MEGIEAQLVMGNTIDDRTGAKPQGQPKHIQKGISFMTDDITPRNDEMVPQHEH